MDYFVIEPCALAVAAVGYGSVLSNTKVCRSLNRIDIGTKEKKLPELRLSQRYRSNRAL